MPKALTIGFLLLVATTAAAEENAKTAALADTGRQISDEFQEALSAELQKAMAKGGAGRAIAVCRKKAPRIAANLSQKYGWEIGRTSLKVRNPRNAPDPWERSVLRAFTVQNELGHDPATKLEHAERVKEGDIWRFRYMKAIPTRKPCLTCHGRDLDPAVAKRLQKLYPHDQATGFEMGDIRGAFTLSRTLD